MIIRLTMAESDFIDALEQFALGLKYKMFEFDEPAPCVSDYSVPTDYIVDYNNWIHRANALKDVRAYLMNPENRFKPGSKEHKEIIEEVLRQWELYAPTVDLEEFTPNVSIQYELAEKWENSEVVYYFTAYDRTIIQ